uniref:Uncharacterized protein n=1 Tax=Oryza glumipatula TaxID=40148 RepID=A0A0D9YE75_9ORYZ
MKTIYSVLGGEWPTAVVHVAVYTAIVHPNLARIWRNQSLRHDATRIPGSPPPTSCAACISPVPCRVTRCDKLSNNARVLTITEADRHGRDRSRLSLGGAFPQPQVPVWGWAIDVSGRAGDV